jgi:two-component system, LytTR family, response regulator
MTSLRVLIVDDEPLIRSGIRRGLTACEGIEILGECESCCEAIETILQKRPDVVLLDVQLSDCTGLDVVREVGAQRMPAVIFVTAYDEYAVQAFELNAVDYLLKPFDDERLHRSIARVRERLAASHQNSVAEHLQRLLDARQRTWPDRIVVRNGERYEFVPVPSIDWAESANNYVQIHCGPKDYLLGETLTNLAARLDPARFLRIHRCRLVNLSRIIAVHPLMSGTYEMELRSGVRLTTGRQYKDAVQALIKT